MKSRMTLAKASAIAQAVRYTLAPACERIAVAGSIRRMTPTVGDVELMVVPKREEALFGQPDGQSKLDKVLRGLIEEGRLELNGANGDKYKRFVMTKPGVQLDLWITSAECWGVNFAIRTGNADFARDIVTQRHKGGHLPDDMLVRDGRVWQQCDPGSPPPPGSRAFDSGHYVPLDTPEEDDLIGKICGLPWLEPFQRRGGLRPLPPARAAQGVAPNANHK